MDNEQKSELRRSVIRLGIVGYDKKKIIEILEIRGFKKQTISNYYNALKDRFSLKTPNKS